MQVEERIKSATQSRDTTPLENEREGGAGRGDVHLADANNVDARILHTVACGHILEARVTSVWGGLREEKRGWRGRMARHQVVTWYMSSTASLKERARYSLYLQAPFNNETILKTK